MQIKFTFKIEIQQMEGEGLLRGHMTQFLESLIVWDSVLSVSGVLFEPHKSGKFQKTSRRVILLTQMLLAEFQAIRDSKLQNKALQQAFSFHLCHSDTII